ncbi:MAG: mechanosensitive ion channel family protein [Propionibacteriaceae bacterium]|nr:mechanosensitive ion channel family protein [Propionibacteriaceae bacterium]
MGDEVPQFSIEDLERPLFILIVIVAAFVARWLVSHIIKFGVRRTVKQSQDMRKSSGRGSRLMAVATGVNSERYEKRVSTIGTLLHSIATFAIVTIALIAILAIYDVPIGPLLASAGLGGVALGFGAQALIKDFLAGISMIIEDQYGVGDLIDTGQVTGTVEDVRLRVTQLRDISGQIWYVRNGEILRVGNHSQGWSTAIVDLPIKPEEDVSKSLAALESVADLVYADPKFADLLLDRPVVVGVNELTPTAMTLRITAKTESNKHWNVQRELLARSQEAFVDAGIHMAQIAHSVVT